MSSVASSSTATPTIMDLNTTVSNTITQFIDKAQADGLLARIPHLEKLRELSSKLVVLGVQVDSLQHKVITGNLASCAAKAVTTGTAELLEKYTRLMQYPGMPQKAVFEKVVAYLQILSEFTATAELLVSN